MSLPPITYPSGFFTELIRRHEWPPGFVSQISNQGLSDVDRRAAAVRGRETALAKGNTGTVFGMSRSADAQAAASKPAFNARNAR